MLSSFLTVFGHRPASYRLKQVLRGRDISSKTEKRGIRPQRGVVARCHGAPGTGRHVPGIVLAELCMDGG